MVFWALEKNVRHQLPQKPLPADSKRGARKPNAPPVDMDEAPPGFVILLIVTAVLRLCRTVRAGGATEGCAMRVRCPAYAVRPKRGRLTIVEKMFPFFFPDFYPPNFHAMDTTRVRVRVHNWKKRSSLGRGRVEDKQLSFLGCRIFGWTKLNTVGDLVGLSIWNLDESLKRNVNMLFEFVVKIFRFHEAVHYVTICRNGLCENM